MTRTGNFTFSALLLRLFFIPALAASAAGAEPFPQERNEAVAGLQGPANPYLSAWMRPIVADPRVTRAIARAAVEKGTVTLPTHGRVSVQTALATLAGKPELQAIRVSWPSGKSITVAETLGDLSLALSSGKGLDIALALNQAVTVLPHPLQAIEGRDNPHLLAAGQAVAVLMNAYRSSTGQPPPN